MISTSTTGDGTTGAGHDDARVRQQQRGGGARGRINQVMKPQFGVIKARDRKVSKSLGTEVLTLKHESRILGQWSNHICGSRKSQASSP